MTSSSSSTSPTFLHVLVSYIGAGFLYLVGKTTFIRSHDSPKAALLRRNLGKNSFIYAFWHNQQVFLAYAHRHEKVKVVVSQSKDGEYIAQVMKRMGMGAIRGSTSRGGTEALREAVRDLRSNGTVGFSPDGPRGPLETIHPGVIASAKLANVPIVPVGSALTQKLEFNSWDRFQLPLPFGVAYYHHGDPFSVSDLSAEEATRVIRANLNAMTQKAQADVDSSPSWFAFFLTEIIFRVYQIFWIIFFPFILLGAGLKFGLKRGLKDFSERLGFGAPLKKTEKRTIWVHAASLGEWRAAKPLVDRFLIEGAWRVLVTTTTPEGKALVQKETSVDASLLPFDAPILMSRFVKKMNPEAIVVVETEIWPGLVRSARSNGIPLFLVNGRLSEKSAKRWSKAASLSSDLLGSFHTALVRGEEDARRFQTAGLPGDRIETTGNLKIDNLPQVFLSKNNVFGGSPFPVLLVGSSWPGEEEWALHLWKRLSKNEGRLILAPRKLERIPEIETLVRQAGLTPARWSAEKEKANGASDVLLVDTMGDLSSLYGAADVAFIGGSLFRNGGQNPLEAAAAGAALVFGPGMKNFKEEAHALSDAGAALWGGSLEETERFLELCLNDDLKRQALASNAKAFVEANRGAAEKTFCRLTSLL